MPKAFFGLKRPLAILVYPALSLSVGILVLIALFLLSKGLTPKTFLSALGVGYTSAAIVSYLINDDTIIKTHLLLG